MTWKHLPWENHLRESGPYGQLQHELKEFVLSDDP